MRRLTVQDYEAGRRLDSYLGRLLRGAPRSFIYRMLRKKNITLNGRRAEGSEKLAAGDEVTLYLSEETLEKFSGADARGPVPGSPAGGAAAAARRDGTLPDRVSGGGRPGRTPLAVLYEDRDTIFLNKPAGMLSQKAKPEDVSVCEYLTDYLVEEGALSPEALAAFRPGVCNRLDRNTSGVIAAGKTTRGLQGLSAMFRERSVDKFYLCLVSGVLREPSRLSGFLVKDEASNTVRVSRTPPGDAVETEFRPLESDGAYTLLAVKLITGKTHQIRAHLAACGHPVLGDVKYGDRETDRRLRGRVPLRRQMLHAWRLVFPAETGSLPDLAGRTVTAPLPRDFTACLRELGFRVPR